MNLRRATGADIDALLGLQQLYYREEEYPYNMDAAREAWAALVANSTLGLVWVIEAGADLGGYVAVTFGYSLEYLGRDACVDELYVAGELRGRGLGRRALQAAEAACLKADVRALHLEVECGKEAATDLYRSLGFKKQKRSLMTKRLDPAVQNPG